MSSGGDERRVSRRTWVASVPAIAATIGATWAAAAPGGDDRQLGARLYNIRDFGAVGDGATLDTTAVQSAIDTCTRERGGTVLVPAGDFLIGTVELKSNVTLHLVPQGRLLGSPRRADYSHGNGIPPGNGNVVMLFAANATNVAIEGRGTIDGDGANFYTGVGDATGPGGRAAQTQPANVDRPHLMVFYRCTNLSLRDAFFTRAAYHCCRILQCKFVRIDGIRIYNRVNKNNDGFHFNDTQYVNISNCNVQCQDDACALFGSNKFVTVTNCSFSTRWSIFRFGGGECENIAVSNCLIYDTYGCPIKMHCGGRARFENMSFSNLVMKNVTGPITIGLSSRSGRRRPATTQSSDAPATQPSRAIVRNISFNNIRATVVTGPVNHPDIPFDVKPYPGETRQCIVINGTNDDFIENVSFTDVHVTFPGGGTAEEAAVRDVPQIAGEYFQIGTPPAWGIFARNVRGLTLSNVRLETATPDLRPAVVFDHVQDASVNALAAAGNEQAESVLRFIDSRDVLLASPRVLTPAATFLQIEGDATENITIDGGCIARAAKALAAARGAVEKSVTLRA
jgi:polygalacturonase